MRAKPNADLVNAFKALLPEEVKNFRHHMRKGTTIVCSSYNWLDGNGGG